MQEPADTKKGKTIESISIWVLRLEISKGHLKWKVTDLESRARISRSMVYRYLGSTKEDILRNALQIFTASFYGFGKEDQDIPFAERVQRTRVFLIENPEVAMFYLKWRGTDTWLARELMKAEEKARLKLQRLFPHLNETQITMIRGFLHGLVTAPFLSGDEALASGQELERLIKTIGP